MVSSEDIISSALIVKANGTLIPLGRVEDITSWSKTSNINYVEQSRRDHPIAELESICRAFL